MLNKFHINIQLLSQRQLCKWLAVNFSWFSKQGKTKLRNNSENFKHVNIDLMITSSFFQVCKTEFQ